jgi:CHAT domain-containing protein/tetratricopeptide (TPR) repeat protein
MRALVLLGVLTIAFPLGAARQEPPRAPTPDPSLVQRFVDAEPGDARQRLVVEIAEMRTAAFRSALISASVAHSKQGRRANAIRGLEAASELATLTNSPRTHIAALINLGMVYGLAAEYRDSARYLNEALKAAEAAGDEELAANAGNNLGNVYRRRGQWDLALETYTKVLAVNEAAGRETQVARTLNNIGLTYQEQGDFRASAEYYLRSLELKERVAPDDVISTLGNIGSVYLLQGNHTQAIEYLDRALLLAEKAKDVRLMVGTLANTGRALIETGRYDDAEARLTRALALSEQAGLADRRGGSLSSLGHVYMERGRWDIAADYLSRARAVFEDIGDPLGKGRVLTSLARIEIERGRPEAGVRLAEQARDALAALGTPTALIDAEQIFGQALTELRRWDAAIATFERAIELTERGLSLVAGDAEARLRYLESATAPYFGLAHAYASAGRPADALAAAERGRARTLLDMLAAGLPGADELSPADRERQVELTAAMVALNERIATEGSRARAGAARDRALSADIDRLRRSRDEFYLGLDARHPRLRFARGAAPVPHVDEIAAALPPRSALVEFVVGPRTVWVLALVPRANQAPRLVARPAGLPPAKLLALAGEFSRQVASRDLAFAANARGLYDALFGPVDAELTGVDHLVVVPHAGLWQVPFQALQTPRRRHLIEEHAIGYAPSASALKQLDLRRRPRAARPRVVAFGDPRAAASGGAALPNAAREAREVAAVYGTGTVVAVDAEATERRFRELAPGADIIHVATHGVLDNTSPLFSYVMLAGTGGRRSATDGRLEGHEVINMPLGAELVVLSACETARGRIASGEGVVGLSWALFAAGASTAAVSQWPVDSASTTELMAAFHRERRQLTARSAPAPTAQALRAAQLRLLARPESRHPFYWAGFVVIGVP